MDMTNEKLREILASVQSSGIAFAYQKDRTEPDYSIDRAAAEIMALLWADTARIEKAAREYCRLQVELSAQSKTSLTTRCSEYSKPDYGCGDEGTPRCRYAGVTDEESLCDGCKEWMSRTETINRLQRQRKLAKQRLMRAYKAIDAVPEREV